MEGTDVLKWIGVGFCASVGFVAATIAGSRMLDGGLELLAYQMLCALICGGVGLWAMGKTREG